MYKELFQSFQHITYEDIPHKYHSDGKEMISVTTLIKLFTPSFRREYWLKYKTLEANGFLVKSDKSRSVPEDHISIDGENKHYKDIFIDTTLLAMEWQEKSRIGLERGSRLHRYMELAYYGKYEFDERFVCCDKLVADNQHLIPIALEFVVGDLEHMIAGQFDGLFLNTNTNELELHDYKVDEKVEFENRFENMLPPLDFMDQCNGNKYTLQLNLYAWLIERNTGLKIDKLLIQNFKPKTYITYEIEKDFGLVELMLKAYGSNDKRRNKYATQFIKEGYRR